MKTVIFKNPDGVDEKILKKITEKLKSEDIEFEFFEKENQIRDVDFCIAFGGDGTILHSAKLCSKYNKAVLGINGGHLGYTAGLEPDEINLIGEIKRGKYYIDKRTMLEIEANGEKFYCVNDAVISKGSLSRMIDFSLFIEDKAVMNTSSDGIIISTPTGSTAYSLSAGGPILDPSIEGILITSICSHSLFDRPIVINDNKVIKVKFFDTRNCEGYLTFDGEASVKLNHGDIITVKKAKDCTANLIRIKQDNFLNILNKKFVK